MKGFKFLVIIVASLMTLCFSLILLKPSVELNPKKQPLSTAKILSPAVDMRTTQISGIQEQELQKDSVSQLELLKQRDHLYTEFANINQNLSLGQQPDTRALDTLLQQQMRLVHKGVLSEQDALNYCHFLRKVMPEMERQLDVYIRELENI